MRRSLPFVALGCVVGLSACATRTRLGVAAIQPIADLPTTLAAPGETLEIESVDGVALRIRGPVLVERGDGAELRLRRAGGEPIDLDLATVRSVSRETPPSPGATAALALVATVGVVALTWLAVDLVEDLRDLPGHGVVLAW